MFAGWGGRAGNRGCLSLRPVVSEAEGSGEGASFYSGLSRAVRALSWDQRMWRSLEAPVRVECFSSAVLRGSGVGD